MMWTQLAQSAASTLTRPQFRSLTRIDPFSAGTATDPKAEAEVSIGEATEVVSEETTKSKSPLSGLFDLIRVLFVWLFYKFHLLIPNLSG